MGDVGLFVSSFVCRVRVGHFTFGGFNHFKVTFTLGVDRRLYDYLNTCLTANFVGHFVTIVFLEVVQDDCRGAYKTT